MIRVDQQHELKPARGWATRRRPRPGAGNSSKEAMLLSRCLRPTTAILQRCCPDRSKSALLLLAATDQQQQTGIVVVEGSRPRPRRGGWGGPAGGRLSRPGQVGRRAGRPSRPGHVGQVVEVGVAAAAYVADGGHEGTAARRPVAAGPPLPRAGPPVAPGGQRPVVLSPPGLEGHGDSRLQIPGLPVSLDYLWI